MITDKKVVAIGGGTGLSTMLRGLKLYTKNLTAVVTVADDGGSSGMLRNDLGMLPPGDIRNCILALADIEPTMYRLLNYRFTEGTLAGHSFGNLFLAALNGISGGFDEAVSLMNSVLAVTGRVLPVTTENIALGAVLESGMVINGESNIGHRNPCGGKIDRVFLTPERPQALPDVISAIDSAEIIVLGPGSLYTSIIPNLLVDGVCDAIKRNTSAVKIYVCNIMTQSGETDGYTAYDHLRAIERHSFDGIVDFVIANNAPVPHDPKMAYAAENAYIVSLDEQRFEKHSATLVQGNLLLAQNEHIRHNFSRLARSIMLLERHVKRRRSD